MSQVQFKYGSFSNLKSTSTTGLNEGCIYVTTDTHSMFMDLKDSSGTLRRFRIGDFETYENLQDLAKDSANWYEGSLALITNSNNSNGANTIPILAYYNGESWSNINDTSALQTALEDKIKTVSDNLNTLTDTVESHTAAITSIGTQIEDINTEIENINTKIGTKPESITGQTIWSAIENLVGGTGGDLSLASLKIAIENNTTAISTEKSRAEAAENALSERVGNIETNYATKEYTDKAEEDAISSAAGYTDSQVSAAVGTANSYTDEQVEIEKNRAMGIENSLQTDINNINNSATGILAQAKKYTDDEVKELADGTVAANTQAIADINHSTTGILAKAKEYTDDEIDKVEAVLNPISGKVNTLVAEDTGKSVRTIANEELAAQLLSGEADADFKTLQQLAAWLENHPEDVADINLAIQLLQAKTVLGTDGDGVEYTTVKAYVEAIEDDLIARITATDNKLNWGTF